jgi:hypothetical protein
MNRRREAGPSRGAGPPVVLPPGSQSAARWPAPREHPTTYPGAAPDHSYLLVRDHVAPLVAGVAADGSLALTLADGTALEVVLDRLGAAPLAERIPVVAYGANRGPRTLALKLAHRPRAGRGLAARDAPGGLAGPPPPVVVPVLRAVVADLDVVAAGLSRQGFAAADLIASPGTRVEVMITLLDADQAAAVHDSEGVGAGRYDLAELPGGVEVTGTGGRLDVLAYVSWRPVFESPETGTPLALGAIAAIGRAFPDLDQVAVLAHVLRVSGLQATVAALAGVEPGAARRDGEAVARALAALLSAEWWRRHHTGAPPSGPAEEAWAMVGAAMTPVGPSRSTAARLAGTGAVLSPAEAYGAGPGLRLAARPLW